MSSTTTKCKGAAWPRVASRGDRVEWATGILRQELSVELPPVRMDTDLNLRLLALGILHSLAWDEARGRAEDIAFKEDGEED